jgi:hypothetical protein
MLGQLRTSPAGPGFYLHRVVLPLCSRLGKTLSSVLGVPVLQYDLGLFASPTNTCCSAVPIPFCDGTGNAALTVEYIIDIIKTAVMTVKVAVLYISCLLFCISYITNSRIYVFL